MLRKLLRKLRGRAEPDTGLFSMAELPEEVVKLLSSTGDQCHDFSVIIPTMWKNPALTRKLLLQLEACDCVEEIIVIGNASNPEPFQCAKMRILPQAANIYVNPAWNLGVESCRGSNLIILNDDLLIESEMIQFMSRVSLTHIGMAGVSTQSMLDIDAPETAAPRHALKLSLRMNYGYGTCMFLHKSHYFPIPETLKIYYGDSFLYDSNHLRGFANLTLQTRIRTKMSVTSGLRVFNPVKEQDSKAWPDIYKRIAAEASELKANRLEEKNRN